MSHKEEKTPEQSTEQAKVQSKEVAKKVFTEEEKKQIKDNWNKTIPDAKVALDRAFVELREQLPFYYLMYARIRVEWTLKIETIAVSLKGLNVCLMVNPYFILQFDKTNKLDKAIYQEKKSKQAVFSLERAELLALMVHEIEHLIRDCFNNTTALYAKYPDLRREAIHSVFNIAQDAVINRTKQVHSALFKRPFDIYDVFGKPIERKVKKQVKGKEDTGAMEEIRKSEGVFLENFKEMFGKEVEIKDYTTDAVFDWIYNVAKDEIKKSQEQQGQGQQGQSQQGQGQQGQGQQGQGQQGQGQQGQGQQGQGQQSQGQQSQGQGQPDPNQQGQGQGQQSDDELHGADQRQQGGHDYESWFKGPYSPLDDHSENMGNSESRDIARQAARDLVQQAKTEYERTHGTQAGLGIGAEMEQLISDLFKADIPWNKELRSTIKRNLVAEQRHSNTTINQGYPAIFMNNRRTPIMYGTKADEKQNVCVAIDVSGSMDDKQLSKIKAELEEIQRQGLKITVIQFDGDIRSIEKFTRHSELKRKGNGGTCFAPVFEKIKDREFKQKFGVPDILVFFTDACCYESELEQPKIPVLWAVVGSSAHPPVDWGKRIEITF